MNELAQRSPEKLEMLAKAWNLLFPIGTPVIRYRLIDPLQEGYATETTSEAWVMGGHSVVAKVKYDSGGMLIESLIPTEMAGPHPFDLTPKQLHILQHSLGADQYGQGEQYRNRYYAGPRTTSCGALRGLVNHRLMEDDKPGSDEMRFFGVTEAGILVMKALSPDPPEKIALSKARYKKFSGISECYRSFADFLGIDRPWYECLGDFGKGWRMRNSSVIGNWKPTQKEAKASYKECLKSGRAILQYL